MTVNKPAPAAFEDAPAGYRAPEPAPSGRGHRRFRLYPLVCLVPLVPLASLAPAGQ